MNIKSVLIPIVLVIGLAGCDRQKFNDHDAKPNLVFVFPDQMRSHMLGFMGREPVKTPNLDEFARESKNSNRHIWLFHV